MPESFFYVAQIYEFRENETTIEPPEEHIYALTHPFALFVDTR